MVIQRAMWITPQRIDAFCCDANRGSRRSRHREATSIVGPSRTPIQKIFTKGLVLLKNPLYNSRLLRLVAQLVRAPP